MSTRGNTSHPPRVLKRSTTHFNDALMAHELSYAAPAPGQFRISNLPNEAFKRITDYLQDWPRYALRNENIPGIHLQYYNSSDDERFHSDSDDEDYVVYNKNGSSASESDSVSFHSSSLSQGSADAVYDSKRYRFGDFEQDQIRNIKTKANKRLSASEFPVTFERVKARQECFYDSSEPESSNSDTGSPKESPPKAKKSAEKLTRAQLLQKLDRMKGQRITDQLAHAKRFSEMERELEHQLHMRGIANKRADAAEADMEELRNTQGESAQPSSIRISTALRHPSDIHTSTHEESDILSENSLQRRAKSKISIPAPKLWTGQKDEDVTIFLNRIKHYFESNQESKRNWPQSVLGYLGDKPFQLWNLEMQEISSLGNTPTWVDFISFMRKSFGVVAPERQARAKYDELKQTSTVEAYVNELKKLVRIMAPLKIVVPGEGDLIRKFISGCKPDMREYLNAETPVPFWDSAEQCFQKAINRSANRIDEHKVNPAPKKFAAMQQEGTSKNAKRKAKLKAKKAKVVDDDAAATRRQQFGPRRNDNNQNQPSKKHKASHSGPPTAQLDGQAKFCPHCGDTRHDISMKPCTVFRG